MKKNNVIILIIFSIVSLVTTLYSAKIVSIETIDDFERTSHEQLYWWGSGPKSEVSVRSDQGLFGEYSMRIDYRINSFDYDNNWIVIRRVIGMKDFTSGDALSVWVKGSGSGGEFWVIIEDNDKHKLQYRNEIVLDGNKWTRIIIPFSFLSEKAWGSTPGRIVQQQEIDLTKIVAITFQIALNNNGAPKDVPIVGTCWIDNVELISGAPSMKQPIWSKIPDGYLLTEYYQDDELKETGLGDGKGVYASVNFMPTIYAGNLSLTAKVAVPSKYVISGYKPFREIDFMRGDDFRIVNKPEYAISVKELYANVKDPLPYINMFRLGTLWLRWSPFSLFGQSRLIGGHLIGSMGRAGGWETFVGYDYWKSKLVFGVRANPSLGDNLFIYPTVLIGQQSAKDVNTGEYKPISDFGVYGLNGYYVLKDFKGLSRITISGEYSYESAGKFAFWAKDMDKDPKERTILYTMPFPEPLRTSGEALLLKAVAETQQNIYIGAEMRMITPDFGSDQFSEVCLPWFVEEKSNVLHVERRNENTILQNKFAHIIGVGYNDQQGFSVEAGLRKYQLNLSANYTAITRISNPAVKETTIEVGGETTKLGNGFVNLLAYYGIQQYKDEIMDIKQTYIDVGAKVPVRSNLELLLGYRKDDAGDVKLYHEYFYTKNIMYAEILAKLFPNMSLRLRYKKTDPGVFEMGGFGGSSGSIADTRDGDYKEWSDHLPDSYIQLTFTLNF